MARGGKREHHSGFVVAVDENKDDVSDASELSVVSDESITILLLKQTVRPAAGDRSRHGSYKDEQRDAD